MKHLAIISVILMFTIITQELLAALKFWLAFKIHTYHTKSASNALINLEAMTLAQSVLWVNSTRTLDLYKCLSSFGNALTVRDFSTESGWGKIFHKILKYIMLIIISYCIVCTVRSPVRSNLNKFHMYCKRPLFCRHLNVYHLFLGIPLTNNINCM